MNATATTATGQPARVRLARKRIFILPTRFGLSFTLVLGTMLLGSLNYNNSLGFMLTFLLAALALVSILHTYRNMAGLGLRGGRVRPVFCGEAALLPVCLDNHGQPARPALKLRFPADHGQAVEAGAPADCLHCVTLAHATVRRGWLRPGPVTVSTRYPFGLFRAWSRVDLALACLVYPRPAGTRPLPVSRGASARDGAARGSGGEDFSGLRGYRPGDSPRRIHWKAVARNQGMPVKLFEGAEAGELVLAWADTAGDAEARLSQLCRWVLDAERQGFRYGLELPGTALPAASGETHLHRCLAALALHDPPGD